MSFSLKTLTIILFSSAALSLSAQQKSAKRGMCWSETQDGVSYPITSDAVTKMSAGVSWVYNWAETPKSEVANLGPDKDMAFLPMCWNGSFNETKLRTYLTNHPGVKYLLGFNEPNLVTAGHGGSQMTPAQAVAAWPKLEQIAADFNVELVAPALNFTGDNVGGKVWAPFEWYDEFFRLYPTARVDYLAFHSYMNWAENVDWICSRYFYTDKGKDDLYTATNKAKYPNLVKFLDDYKAANGHFPRMFLTEFCSWEGNVYPYTAGITVDFQIDQMTQKLQYMEKSDLVAGYAWFMANPKEAPATYPHNSIFTSRTAGSNLSDLGKVYVYMSSFDTEKYYAPGENIMAKDYVDASDDNQQVKVRPNTESGSTAPLQVELPQSAWATYQVNIPEGGAATLTLHVKSSADNTIGIYLDGFGTARRIYYGTLSSTNGAWADRPVTLTNELTAGNHTLTVWNGTSPSFYLNALQLSVATGIHAMTNDECGVTNEPTAIYDLQGRKVAETSHLPKGIYIHNGRKVVIR